MRVTSFVSAVLLGLTVVSAAPADFSTLDARALDVEYKREAPKQEKCPASNNGPDRNYAEHDYTKNQLTAAFRSAATLQADGKQIGDNKYPHKFNNNEKLEFKCGEDKMEFPIQLDGKTYDGGDTSGVPDRLVYEYVEKKGKLQVQFCGVIRHGPAAAFLNCMS